MGRKNSSLSFFEPLEPPQSPQKTVTCIDFHTLPTGNLGFSTQHLCTSGSHEEFQQSQPITVPATKMPSSIAREAIPELSFDEMVPANYTDVDDEKDSSPEVHRKEKRPPYTPLPHWTLKRDTFLYESIRLEGRGDYSTSFCPFCERGEALYRCTQCVGAVMLCRKCAISSHQLNPLHIFEQWTDDCYFQRITLKSIGLSIQLGHTFGTGCPKPKRPHKGNFTVIDLSGIQEVDLKFCDCHMSQPQFVQILRFGWYPASVDRPQTAATNAVLRFFDLLNFESKASMFEFYQTLVRLTDNTGADLEKDRYPAWLIMVREIRNLKALKRGGRGHMPGGATGTEPGELAVLCPACPQPGKNMGKGKSRQERHKYFDTLFLAIDANFRLKRRDVSDEIRDPGLSDGCSYIVPQKAYQAHLTAFDDKVPQPKSTCSAHKAVNNDRCGKGLAATGLAAVDCARHDMKRPLAVGDLQRGERYLNMDYLFFTSMKKSSHPRVVVSYDICCQWSKNLWERMKGYPKEMTIDAEKQSNFTFLVPKFHLPAHKAKCQTRYSFNFSAHVGRTDGEAPERGWARINPFATSSTEMGPGSRRDALDAHFGDTNWRKSSTIDKLLDRRLREAVQEAKDYCFFHHQFSLGLEPDQIAEFETQLKEWQKDKSKQNPFEKKYASITMNKVYQRLHEEEKKLEEENPDYVKDDEVSAVELISMGLNLEEQQRQLVFKKPEAGASNPEKESYHERASALRLQIEAWIDIQDVYASTLKTIRKREARASPPNQPETPVSDIRLYLPSALPKFGFNPDALYGRRLVNIEYHLRSAQADDALYDLRNQLRLKSYLLIDKQRFRRGQIQSTRSRTIISRVQNKVDAAAAKYRKARKAISELASVLEVDWKNRFPKLAKADIRGFEDDDLPFHMKVKLTMKQKKELMKKTSKKYRRKGPRLVSWIWRRAGAHRLVDDIALEDLRIEFCKSKARADRWREEVLFLQVEMERVLEFYEWRKDTWEALAKKSLQFALSQGLDVASAEGLKAYATQQAKMFANIRERCQETWASHPVYDVDAEGMVVAISKPTASAKKRGRKGNKGAKAKAPK